MKKKPAFSFIIPVYNMGDTLPDALKSVSEIRGPDFEVVLINDGSTDETAMIVEAFREKIDSREDVFLSVETVDNSGRGAARNLGIKKARGEYISFLDADDTIDPDEFMKLWNCVDKDGGRSDMIIGQFMIVGEDGEIYTQRELPLTTSPKQLLRKIALSPFSPIHMNAMLIRRTLFDLIDEFDTQNINAEDKDVTIQLLRNASGVTICQSFHYLYHKHRIGRLNMAKKRLFWLWFRQKSLVKNYTGGLRAAAMILQVNYDLAKLLYEMLFGYQGRKK